VVGPNAGLNRFFIKDDGQKPLTAKIAKKGREGREENPMGYFFL